MASSTFWKGKKVLVTGGAGFIGSHLVKRLVEHCGVSSADVVVPRSQQLDLRDPDRARRAVQGCQIVFHLAAVTGGISFSRAHPATQYHDTSLIDLNVIEAAKDAGVEKLIAIGNMFAYAAEASMPLSEDQLFDGLPSPSHRGVGLMKRNLASLSDLYHREHGFSMVVVFSANAFGPGDSTDAHHSHVIPGTIMKCLSEPKLVVWGDGTPTRDFLYVEDVAAGLVLAAERLEAPAFVNLGSGSEISIRDLVSLIAKHTGFAGPVEFDSGKGGGDARRCASIEQATRQLGFAPRVSMDEGMRLTVEWYRNQLGLV